MLKQTYSMFNPHNALDYLLRLETAAKSDAALSFAQSP